MLPGGGSAFLFGSHAIFPLHPLQRETLPNTNVTQNGVSTRGRCWLAGWTGDVAICAAEDGLAIGTRGGGWPSVVHCPEL